MNGERPGGGGESGFESAGSILKRTAPELIVSKRRGRQLERIELVRAKREQKNQSLCFSSRPFVLCGLPARKLSAGGNWCMSGAMGSSCCR